MNLYHAAESSVRRKPALRLSKTEPQRVISFLYEDATYLSPSIAVPSWREASIVRRNLRHLLRVNKS
ncbi:hypothetical protein FNW02_24320 [Komarekiella sp. 'clone 1']|uniref:Uncharacterized protein n=1 Tax=Komarekiella delphini-convector SJRDD-AB1 TaxID=2593771 RepID=A0AA40T1D2_9NOST|nr:hypothetical protein [Komarekiella delphini-convector SJRDD-AB1]